MSQPTLVAAALALLAAAGVAACAGTDPEPAAGGSDTMVTKVGGMT